MHYVSHMQQHCQAVAVAEASVYLFNFQSILHLQFFTMLFYILVSFHFFFCICLLFVSAVVVVVIVVMFLPSYFYRLYTGSRGAVIPATLCDDL